jgi:hypothetical protein
MKPGYIFLIISVIVIAIIIMVLYNLFLITSNNETINKTFKVTTNTTSTVGAIKNNVTKALEDLDTLTTNTNANLETLKFNQLRNDATNKQILLAILDSLNHTRAQILKTELDKQTIKGDN